jgi:hypothetical protein
MDEEYAVEILEALFDLRSDVRHVIALLEEDYEPGEEGED